MAAVQRGGQRELIYDVEGTAAQIEATLSSLAAQPDVFLSFSVNRPQGELTPTHLEFEQQTHVYGPPGGPGAVGQLDVVVRQRAQQQPVDQSAPRQRVLFVLHVLAGAHSPAAAKAGGSSGAAKPAGPAVRPAAPAPHK